MTNQTFCSQDFKTCFSAIVGGVFRWIWGHSTFHSKSNQIKFNSDSQSHSLNRTNCSPTGSWTQSLFRMILLLGRRCAEIKKRQVFNCLMVLDLIATLFSVDNKAPIIKIRFRFIYDFGHTSISRNVTFLLVSFCSTKVSYNTHS